jgi:hypothetical protein
MPLTFDEANAILSGKDPRSQSYYDRDWPDLNLRKEVDAAFEAKYPGQFNLVESLPVDVNSALNQELGISEVRPTAPEATQPVTQPEITQPEQPAPQEQETTSAQGSYDVLWDTPEKQLVASLEQQYGSAALPQMTANARTVFDGYLERYPEDRRYVQEMLMRLGNHPSNFRFLDYLAWRLQMLR